MKIKAIMMASLASERRVTRDTVAAMTDGDMQFRPTPEQMAFGAQALHIISAYATLLGALQGQGWQWNQGFTLEQYPTQGAILALIDEVSARFTAHLDGLADDALLADLQTGWGTKESLLQLLFAWAAHEGHHRGQMVTYLRMKGFAPAPY